jgi:hypothetical protein
MPRKRRHVRLSEYKIPPIDPEDRNAVEDHTLVRQVLVDFDEVAVLPSETREQLVAYLVGVICFVRAGVKAGKHGMSNKDLAIDIYMSGVWHALEQVGLPAKRWRKWYDNGSGESFYFRLARALADVSGIPLPKDLKLRGMRAAQHQYGVMSPAMKAAQAAELAARGRQRLGDLAVRLKTPLAAWQRRVDGLVVRLQAAAPKVQG